MVGIPVFAEIFVESWVQRVVAESKDKGHTPLHWKELSVFQETGMQSGKGMNVWAKHVNCHSSGSKEELQWDGGHHFKSHTRSMATCKVLRVRTRECVKWVFLEDLKIKELVVHNKKIIIFSLTKCYENIRFHILTIHSCWYYFLQDGKRFHYPVTTGLH